MKPQITNFENGIQRIVKEVVARQGANTPIICVQGEPNSGKSELISRLHEKFSEHDLNGWAGDIRHILAYRQEILEDKTVLRDPACYVICDLISPATYINIHQYFGRMPDLGVRMARELPCAEMIQEHLAYFNDILSKFCRAPKKPAFDLIVHNPDAKDKQVRTYGRRIYQRTRQTL